MFSPAKVLYISDYDFGPEHDHRNKYLVILHNFDEKVILLSLTTSQCHIPDAIKEYGCIQQVENNIHSFHFPKDKVVSDCGFFFPKDTFIDINQSQVFEREILHITTKYVEPGKTSEKCKLSDSCFYELLYCIYKSKFIPQKTKRSLEPVLEKLSKNN